MCELKNKPKKPNFSCFRDLFHLQMSNKRKVSYFYDPEVGNYHYGAGHPMKPHRIQITNSLVFDYDLHKHMAVYTPAKSSEFELMRYHSREYVEFLKKITPDNKQNHKREMRKFNVGEDSPVFSDMYDFICSYTGASVQAAHHLNIKEADIAVNWSGGLQCVQKYCVRRRNLVIFGYYPNYFQGKTEICGLFDIRYGRTCMTW